MPLQELLVFQSEAGGIPIYDWLKELKKTERRAYVKCIERISSLIALANELGPPRAKAMRDGIWELRARCGQVHYRILFFFLGRAIACLSHGFKKGGKGNTECPDNEIETAISRRTQVQSNRDKYTATWELDQ